MVKKFKKAEEATEFALKYYGKVAEMLTESERSRIGMIQASGRSSDKPSDKKCLDAIETLFKNNSCGVPYDIIAYRGGEMNFTNRPYVSASLLFSPAKYYAQDTKVHKIIIKKGAIIFPLRALDKIYGDKEAEIIIATDRLKRRFGYYIYK